MQKKIVIMCRQITWCYVFLITVLEISQNCKLTAQGKNHGGSRMLHDSIIDGITFQEWGGAVPASEASSAEWASAALRLEPAALEFGARALCQPHAARVTVHNLSNGTLHLASVSGTTPDFHASFFDLKSLPPRGNTSFSVVYLGRRAGPARAHLFLHTSAGVLRYAVAAHGEPSDYRLWPLLSLRIPANVSYRPELVLHNPGERPLQVLEVHSSARWLGLALPTGTARAPRSLWSLPPHTSRVLVTLAAAGGAAGERDAYLRVRLAGAPPLVLRVEAQAAPPGVLLALPLQVMVRGSLDPPTTLPLLAANSAPRAAELRVRASLRCDGSTGDGAVLRQHARSLPPHSPLAPAATLTMHWRRAAAGGEGCGSESCWRWCRAEAGAGGGWAWLRARVVSGTLRLRPPELVAAWGVAEPPLLDVVAVSEFSVPIHLTQLVVPPEVDLYFHRSSFLARSLAAGESARVLVLRARRAAPPLPLDTSLRLLTNVSDYSVRLLAFDGKLRLHWYHEGHSDGDLHAGLLSWSATRRVRGAVLNGAPTEVCVTALSTDAPGAALSLQPACVPARGRAGVLLTLVAPAKEVDVRGVVTLTTPHATTRHALTLSAAPGRILVAPVLLAGCAPFVWCRAPLVLSNTFARHMQVTRVQAALRGLAHVGSGGVRPGTRAAGRLLLRPERDCGDLCYAGLTRAQAHSWTRRISLAHERTDEVIAADLSLWRVKRELFANMSRAVSLRALLHTTQVLAAPLTGSVRWSWPALSRRGAGDAAVTAAGGARAVDVLLTNPSSSHAVLLQPVLGDAAPGLEATLPCDHCQVSPSAFRLVRWAGGRGAVRERPGGGGGLLLAPGANLTLHVQFAPQAAHYYVAPLYIRNNLTVVEVVWLRGRGAVPRVSLGGRSPGAALTFSVPRGSCAGSVQRALWLSNTGALDLNVDRILVGGSACSGGGFSVLECAAFVLRPGESRRLTVRYSADLTLAAATRPLHVAGATYWLRAEVPRSVLAGCPAPRPGWEGSLRRGAECVAALVLLGALFAAVLDADRLLRPAHPRHAAPPATLDLRALSAAMTVAAAAAGAGAGSAPRPPARRLRRREPPDARDSDSDTDTTPDSELDKSCEPCTPLQHAQPVPAASPLPPARLQPRPATPSDTPADAAPFGTDTTSTTIRRPKVVRREKPIRRRSDRAPPTKPTSQRSPPANNLRWGTTFSEVVARDVDTSPDTPAAPPAAPPAATPATTPATGTPPPPEPPAQPAPPALRSHPLGPIGERRPAPATPAASLFYYQHDHAWSQDDRYGSYSSVWGARGVGNVTGVTRDPEPDDEQWAWPNYVSPPPGFTHQQAAVPLARAYDPFESLSSIWTPRPWAPPRPRTPDP